MKRLQAENLSTVLQRSPALAELSARIALMAAVQKVVDSQWASLNLRVLSMRDGVLNLATRSAALAAKARQMEPSMLGAVQRANPSILSIRFKPDKNQGGRPQPVPVPRDRQIGSDSLEHLQMAASQMAPGPTRSALERLIRRQLSQD